MVTVSRTGSSDGTRIVWVRRSVEIMYANKQHTADDGRTKRVARRAGAKL